MDKIQYLKKNLEILIQKPLKKSKYISTTKLDEIIQKAKIEKPEIKINKKDATIKDQAEDNQLIQTISLEEPPKDQYQAKGNSAIEKATAIIIKESTNRKKTNIKIISKEKTTSKAIIIVPKNCEITIIEEHVAEKESILSETFIIGENSIVNYARKTKPQGEIIIHRQFILGKDSKLIKSDSWSQGTTTYSNTQIIMHGDGSESKDYSFLIGTKNQNFNINYSAIHRGKNTKSHCIFKSAMKDQSKNTFEGMIKIEEKAEKTNALLECHGMLLGEQATNNQIPSLEIKTDDVKATHSATIAHISEEELFYLQSRGIEKEQAKKIIVKSFLESIIFELADSIKQELEEEIEKRL
jgi:Fe-S cluster assembly scaffold protein SufB